MQVIYVGDKYYFESGTIMSSVYQIDDAGSFKRTDWGEIQEALKQEKEIHIRPATEIEILWADAMLLEILTERRLKQLEELK